MNLDTLNRAELFEEVTELAREQGITDQAEWNELCNEVVDSHFEIGELNDDQDLEGVKAALHLAWNEYQREAGPESANAIAEDPNFPSV
jgi:hypothetical protein